jgi:hypothetical protein
MKYAVQITSGAMTYMTNSLSDSGVRVILMIRDDWLLAGQPRDRSSSSDRVKTINSPCRAIRLRDPLSLLSNGYRGLLPWGKAARA